MSLAKNKNGLLPSSLRIISSCLKTVTANAGNVASTVRLAGSSVSSSISARPDGQKDQVLWAGFDKLELGPVSFKRVLLLGYANGFQVLDVEDASNVCELVSMRDGPVTFLQMQPIPVKSELEGFRSSHPLLLIVAGDKITCSSMDQGVHLCALMKDGSSKHHQENCKITPTIVRFYSFKSHGFVHNLRFRSAVYLVRCSPRIVAVALAAQIYCFDAVTLESKFSVSTYPLQGDVGVNTGYGPVAVGPRWLAYTSNNPLLSNTGRLSPQNLTPSPGVSPSTSPGSSSLVARYAMESSKQLAAGILNLSDMGYKTFSKYYQEFVHDGSNSSSLSSLTWRNGRLPPAAHASEADNAGMVVVKDFVSMEIIAQFRAHASPISALCFDPSGTLLVTASVNGHNINVFRIMPTKAITVSNCTHYDWSSSHIHLYKLYRGLTSAVIQDICFSQYSQWITIVSSRGTCHIFILSPFGGDASFQQQSPYCNGPSLAPNLTLPWWSASSFCMDQQFLPPSPLTLSVVSRIKNCSSGWLNTVSSVAASVAGKMSIPSGAIAAVFHNSINHFTPTIHAVVNSFEHLLVYSPSGHLIQHELVPSPELESCGSSSRNGSGHLLQFQDEDLHVIAEPIQWWDVCRRSNWIEREQNISQSIFDNQQNVEILLGRSSSDEMHALHYLSSTKDATNESVKAHERPNGYLSNAEVQVCSGRILIWQKSKVYFYIMIPSITSENTTNCDVDGEIEIEKLASHEVEIKRKDLLPVFKSSHLVYQDSGIGGKYQCSSTQAYESRHQLLDDASCAEHSKLARLESGLDRQREFSFIDHASCSGIAGGKYKVSISDANEGGDLLIKDASCTEHSNIRSVGSGSNAVLSSTADDDMLDLDGVCTRWPYEADNCTQSSNPTIQHALLDESMVSSPILFQTNVPAMILMKYPNINFVTSHANNSLMDNTIVNGFTTSRISNLSSGSQSVVTGDCFSKKVLSSEFSNVSAPILHLEHTKTSGSNNSVEFTQYFNEGYCKVSELDDYCELAGAVTDVDSSSSNCEREKQEDGDNDDMLGGVFSFSEDDYLYISNNNDDDIMC
ncbi:hypothetical protein IEQ34_000535 [Dendrobium chrysotoxum]|uniref:Uncharacterized protein n=1 Tax=Dendrobium chrysotoxum TaxID=161865 RepID=A0AAV7HQQ1_DENCH|nr:hypothetical protein IEQ34_000535 [Dendrobium chrysotoxum]